MEPKLKVLLFRACQAAIWSDEIMSQPERRLLSSMIEEIADTDEERRSLHDHALEDIKQELVLRDVAELDSKSQRRIFEECLSVIRVDREVNSLELRFLRRLGRVCGVVTSGRGANYAFALYADVVLEALEERRLLQKIKPRSFSRPSSRPSAP